MDLFIAGLIFLVVGLIIGAFGTTFFFVLAKNNKLKQLNQKKEASEHRLVTLREYGQNTPWIRANHVNVILLGPRASGKTSIVKLWTNPWTQIEKIVSSTTWHTYKLNIHEHEHEKRYHQLFDVKRRFIQVTRLHIHDYPGEDGYRLQAIKDLEEQTNNSNALEKKTVVIFIMKVHFRDGQVECFGDNEQYFSRAFVDQVDQYLQGKISDKVAKAIIVFHKVDLLPREWDDEVTLQKLLDANVNAVHQIGRVFSPELEYHLTSARTGRGLISLLGKIGIVALDSETEKKRFTQEVYRVGRDFEARGVS